MVTHAFFELLKQFFTEPATNLFPVRNAPQNVHKTLKAVEAGKASINPPVEIPPNFRGKILYDKEACIGCQMCIKVCPAMAIENIAEERKVKFYMARCTFCALCTEICPKNCIKMSDQFIMANLDKYGEDMIVTDSGNFTAEDKPKEEPKKEEPKKVEPKKEAPPAPPKPAEKPKETPPKPEKKPKEAPPAPPKEKEEPKEAPKPRVAPPAAPPMP
jgi:formate hydrogenlyase subunit 6/NADH:ubiquinone oxidoreductase subunit I